MTTPAEVLPPPDTPGPPPPPGAGRGRRWKKLLLAAVFFAALGAFLLGGRRWLSFEQLDANRQLLLDLVDRHYGWMVVAATLVYASATALSLPLGIALSVATGFLFGAWVGTAIVVVAATVGSTLAFLGARYLFADWARERMGPRLKRIARGFEDDAFHYMLFMRLVPIFPFWLINLVPAFTPMKIRTFVAGSAIGMLPGSFVFTNLGEQLGRISHPRELLTAGPMVSLAMLGVLALVPVAWKKYRTRRTNGAPT